MSKQIQGFMNFVREQGVVGLAVGLVLGTAVKGVVDSLVQNIINPLIGVLTGNSGSLEKLHFTLSDQKINYGAFLSTVLQFLIIAAVVYWVVSGLKLDKIDRKKDEAPKAVENTRPDDKKSLKNKK